MPSSDIDRFPVLSTLRLGLRALTAGDAAHYHRVMSFPEVTRFSNWKDAPTPDYIEQYVQKRIENYDGGNGCSWAIEDRLSKEFIGSIRFNYFIKDWRCAEVGYELHPDWWGRGLMTEALGAVMACGHEFYRLHRIDAWTLDGNPASDRVLEKSGFRYEGTVRQKGWWKGAFHDLRIFGRLADDSVI